MKKMRKGGSMKGSNPSPGLGSKSKETKAGRMTKKTGMGASISCRKFSIQNGG